MSLILDSEQLTYIYETLHDRKTLKIFDKETRKQKRICSRLMSLIEEEVLLNQQEEE